METLIVTHGSPDVDAVASAAGAKELYGGKICIPNGLNQKTEKIAKLLDLEPLGYYEGKIEKLVVVDTTDLSWVENFLKNAEEKILIDHHAFNPEYAALFDEVIVREKSSCSEIIYGLMKEKRVKVSKELALAFAAAIFTDSAGFKTADASTFKTLSELLELSGKKFSNVLELVSVEKEQSLRIAVLKAAQRLEINKVNDYLVIVTRVSAFESAVANALMALGADVVIVVNEEEKRIEARARMSLVDKGFNLGLIMQEIQDNGCNGGGHAGAAGINCEDGVKQIEERVLEKIKGKLATMR